MLIRFILLIFFLSCNQNKNTKEICEKLFKKESNKLEIDNKKIIYSTLDNLTPTQSTISLNQINLKSEKIVKKLKKKKEFNRLGFQKYLCKRALKSTKEDINIPVIVNINGKTNYQLIIDGHHKALTYLSVLKELNLSWESLLIPLYQSQQIKRNVGTLSNLRKLLIKELTLESNSMLKGFGYVSINQAHQNIKNMDISKLNFLDALKTKNHLIVHYVQNLKQENITQAIPNKLSQYGFKHNSTFRYFAGELFSHLKKFAKKNDLKWSSGMLVNYSQLYLEDYLYYLSNVERNNIQFQKIPLAQNQFDKLSKKEKKVTYQEVISLLTHPKHQLFLKYISQDNYNKILQALQAYIKEK